jgi:probable rRNA maturation factor
MKTLILNHQTNHPIQKQQLQKLADWLAEKTENKTRPIAWSEVSLVLVDDDGITQTNREYFGKNRPTDVISFRYDPVPGEDDAWCGDLIINVDRAVSEGTARGDINYELALYIAHGFDHLTGAEDDTPEKRKKMRATETAWLRNAAQDGLLENLIG